MTTFKSRVALPDQNRERAVQMLNMTLAATLDLSLQTKQAHWNVKGPQFFARHELFDRLSTELRDIADEMAERVATLGGYAMGTARACAAASILPEYDLRALDGQQHVFALSERFAKYVDLVRRAVGESEFDPATQDIFIESLRKAELELWFLESHINI